MNINYLGIFKRWEIAVARNLINEYRDKWELLKREDIEDLLQECLTQWYFNRKEYDDSREASEKTFMSQIVSNKLGNIVEKIYAKKRKPFYQTIPLDYPLKEDEDTPALIETIEETKESLGDIHLKMDVLNTIRKLTTRQRMICRLLGKEGLTINETCDILKISRPHLYRELKRIRNAFADDNLEEYMK